MINFDPAQKWRVFWYRTTHAQNPKFRAVYQNTCFWYILKPESTEGLGNKEVLKGRDGAPLNLG